MNELPVEAPYFFALAYILVDMRGFQSEAGTTYEDDRVRILDAAGGASLTVTAKAYGDEVAADVLVALRQGGSEVFDPAHALVTSHMESRASSCFEDDHVYTFQVALPFSPPRDVHVFAPDLRSAREQVGVDFRGYAIQGLSAIRTAEQFRASPASGEAVALTDADERMKARLADIEDARVTGDLVYWITYLPVEGGEDAPPVACMPIRAVDLGDAEAALLANRRDEVRRLKRIEVETLVEFLSDPTRFAPPQLMLSNGVIDRDGIRGLNLD